MGHYYESHVTIEPVADDLKLEQVKAIAQLHGFRVADLLMVKRPEDTPERSRLDTFMTSRDLDYTGLRCRTWDVMRDLKQAGVRVWREKIEEILIDIHHKPKEHAA